MDGDRVLPVCCAAGVEARRQIGALVVLVAAEHRLPVIGCRRVLERSCEVVLAVVVVTNGRRIERRAVMELHAVAQRERPVLRVLRGPALRQRRLDQGRARLQLDEALEDLLRHTKRLTVRNQRRIQVRGIRRARKDERCCLRGSACRACGDQHANRGQRQGQPSQLPLNRTPSSSRPPRRTHKYEQKVKPSST